MNLTTSNFYFALEVPPSGGSLEIGNLDNEDLLDTVGITCSPFGGIPRNWKQALSTRTDVLSGCSPFGGIPRNWKLYLHPVKGEVSQIQVPPSGGSLEIGNITVTAFFTLRLNFVPPSGGSLEIGNLSRLSNRGLGRATRFPLRGDP